MAGISTCSGSDSILVCIVLSLASGVLRTISSSKASTLFSWDLGPGLDALPETSLLASSSHLQSKMYNKENNEIGMEEEEGKFRYHF